MPSPFPGMDPYLEDPELFRIFHSSMAIYLQEALQPCLPGSYSAAANERVWIEFSDRYIEPDVAISKQPGDAEAGDGGGVAVAAPPRIKPVLVAVPQDECRELFLEIYARQDGEERLVTVIEILSPTNKATGEGRRDLYVKKQQELITSKVNLIEIDLLRSGEHTTAVPRRRILKKAGPYDYHICVRRFFDEYMNFWLYPILLHEPLPEVEIPLLPDDGPVKVDLQEVFSRCYDAGPYHRRIRYLETAPEPPLTPEQEEWAQGLLAQASQGNGDA